MDSGDEDLDSELRSLELAQAIPNAPPGRTVLPTPIASAVSFATRSSCLALRVGTFIGSYGFDAARVTTLSSLELGRGILEGILTRAGRETLSRSESDLARADAETIIERSLENLHRAMSQVVFWTTTGFHATSTTFGLFSEITQLLLTSLDQLFGSTDSSRAIASIITLIRREFQNPVTGADGQQVGVTDLVMGLCALSYLQRKCWRLETEEARRLGHEEIVWDVVVLNDGERVDVHENSLYGTHTGQYQHHAPGILVSKPGPAPSPSILATLQRHSSQESSDEDGEESPESSLRRQIMDALPPDARASIKTSTLTQKTITVDFQSDEVPSLPAPPGVEVIEREIISPPDHDLSVVARGQTQTAEAPIHRVVYKVEKRRTTSTACKGHEPHSNHVASLVKDFDDSDDSMDETPTPTPGAYAQPLFPTQPPPLPPKRISSVAHQQDSANTPSVLPKPSAPEVKRPRTPHGTQPTASDPTRTSPGHENGSNQKRQRTPLAPLPVKQRRENTRQNPSGPESHKSLPAKTKTEPVSQRPSQKRSSIRQALKRAPGSNLSHLWNRDTSGSGSSPSLGKDTMTVSPPQAPEKPPRPPPLPSRTVASRATGPTIASIQRDRGGLDPSSIQRSSSRSSYISVHETRRDSIVSHADTYSIHSMDGTRPLSPAFSRRDARPSSSMLRQIPGRDHENDYQTSPRSIVSRRSRQRGHTPSLSLYSIATSGSQASLVLSSMHPKSAYTDSEAIDNLRRVGTLNDIFPSCHLLRNVSRFMRFSSASYGSSFLKVLGIASEIPVVNSLDDTHQEIRSFAHHTKSQTDSILLASFVDPQGGSDTTGSTGTGVPLVHYISLDHESKAVVLACRGTLGFEDVLADLACDYDDLHWRGRSYQVHKGVHASARRLLYGGDGRVLYTLKEALDEFSDYGLVLCGHSLGGAVTALLGTMLAEPSPTGTGFVTSAEPHRRLLAADDRHVSSQGNPAHICLPAGRPIHVYAYGPPGTMSPSLRKATRGLITSTVHGNDLVPFLSLGVLHDFQAVALAFKNDGDNSKLEVKQHIWEAFHAGLADRWYAGGSGGINRTTSPDDGGDSPWSIAALTTLRAGMMNPKLLPPGEVFVVESSKVLRRDAFLLAGEEDFGRPAKRVVFKYVRDVESRFREVRFGTSMLMDHSPANYEEALGKLRLGVADAR